MPLKGNTRGLVHRVLFHEHAKRVPAGWAGTFFFVRGNQFPFCSRITFISEAIFRAVLRGPRSVNSFPVRPD